MSESASPSSPSSVLSGCLSLIAGWAVLGIATYVVLAPVHPTWQRVGLSLLSSMFLALGLSSFWSLAKGESGGDKSLAALIRRTREGEPPRDGEPVVVEGVVRPLSSPLTAPLSGVACAAYWYKMYYMGRTSGNRPAQVPVYWGYACNPFAIDSPGNRFRVLAVPLPLRRAQPREGPDAIERARRLIETTEFEPLGGLGSVFEMARDIFTDEDGKARRDWKRPGDERDPQTLLLEETLLPVGASAAVHGLWSAERGAIVSEGSALGTSVSIALGGAGNLSQAPGLGHSTGAYLVTATLLTALGAGLVWFALNMKPS